MLQSADLVDVLCVGHVGDTTVLMKTKRIILNKTPKPNPNLLRI